MSAPSNNIELMIDDYVDGRLADADRMRFEARMLQNEDLKKKVETATQSVEILRLALERVEPSRGFEEKVSSQIISITQSNQQLRLYQDRVNKQGPLTSSDPDAKLLDDPEATREDRRLLVLAGIAAVLFAAAAVTILTVLFSAPSAPSSLGNNPKPPASVSP